MLYKWTWYKIKKKQNLHTFLLWMCMQSEIACANNWLAMFFCMSTFCMHAPSWKLCTEFRCTCVYGIVGGGGGESNKPPNPTQPKQTQPYPTNQFISLWGCVWIGLNLADLFYDVTYNQSPFSDEWVPDPSSFPNPSSQSLLWSLMELSNLSFCDLVFAMDLTTSLGLC